MEARDRFGLGISNCRRAGDVVRAVVEAEATGAEVAFIAEDVNCRDAFQLAALCAAKTSHIRLATGVVNPYTRNPTSLAMAAATLDEISGGRAVLGLGTSSASLITDQMGIPRDKPVIVMRETTEIVRALLAAENVTFAGKRFAYAGARLEIHPVQRQIPIYFAAMGPLMLRLAGRLADGVLLNVGASVEYMRWAIGEIEVGLAFEGRNRADFVVAAWLTTYVTDDYEAGLQRAREWLASVLSVPGQGELLLRHSGESVALLDQIRKSVRAYPHSGDRTAAAQFVPRELAARLTLIGTVQQVRERLEAYRQVGVELPIFGPASLRVLF